ncbi:hypothetical protein MCOR02_009422 [Pyricularia oryzae]|nr:hypothetical protein MCOR02_009422 [Pyricularia oryzae]KAI6308135.1 hypothetical protein MCOR29_009400 [Pyricularia oryzae]KAI6368686.1 hypothetical protein MCOR31_005502 [Pyricularia oryzae]KAI6400594.1 hypothetical protein MCOR24_008565 [Pyricularia oryzae]KAI6401366.1 hypothetical protein MCOR20_008097 [Pyricularia oryzae]
MPNRLAISTMSLGRCYAGHSIEHRLDLAQKYGYEGIEMFFEDLAHVADELRQQPNPASPSTPHTVESSQLAAATHIGDLCRARNLAIISLQPFLNYDGLLDREQHARRIPELRHWISLAHALGTDLIQIPSSMLPSSQTTTDMDAIVADLREAADLGLAASPPVRFAYESIAWSSTSDLWEQSWEAVRRADRPNLGVCLDTFHIAARLFADPTRADGIVPGCQAAFDASVARLAEAIRRDPQRVFWVQVADGERLSSPLLPGHEFYAEGQPPRMSWSRNCRLFYGEEARGAYLPVKPIAHAIFKAAGWEGWVSLELFHRRMADEGSDVAEELAARGAASWQKLVADLQMSVERVPDRAATASL